MTEDRNLAEHDVQEQGTVIPEGEHPIREQDLDREALKVLYRLRDGGYSGYLVGGGVRDLYLGNQPKDFDISTNARPGQLRKLFRNSRTIGRRFRLVQVFFHGNKIVEVSTLRSRSEFEESDKVLPANNTFGTLEEDAFRRDLTINSLFYEIENKTVIDYVGGVEDLRSGVIRIVGDPDQRITRDPVRMLRAIRHAARNDFRIESASRDAITRHVDKLDLCPPSRIRDELLKDLHGGNGRAWFKIALDTGVFAVLFPFYAPLLSGGEGTRVADELSSLLAVIDRLYGEPVQKGRVKIDDSLLFALLLLPWALRRFELMGRELKGPGYHRLSKEIRGELNKTFAHRLNLKRMIKDQITTLFVNLPAFEKFQSKQVPVWLRRKSYFHSCSCFMGMHQESMGGEPVDVSLFVDAKAAARPALTPVNPAKVNSANGNSANGNSANGNSAGSVKRSSRKGVNPAFSSDSKGVFGLGRSSNAIFTL